MDIGNAIRRFRRERDITQEDLANDCEMSRAYLYKLEKGLSSPTIITLEKLAKRMNVPVYILIRYAEIGS